LCNVELPALSCPIFNSRQEIRTKAGLQAGGKAPSPLESYSERATAMTAHRELAG